MKLEDLIARCTGFDWDEGNLSKIWERHRVSGAECEQLFFNHPLVAARDEKHSGEEERYYALGHTDAGRLLFVVFTIRKGLVRPISARDMNRKERKVYESS
ncbi:MAG TPA: BrnT family toxin [Anaerolineales bacterium]